MNAINEEINNPKYWTSLWDHKNVFVPLSLALPIVLLISTIAFRVFKDPGIIARKARELKEFFVTLFTQGENETDSERAKRLARNIALVSLAALGFTGLIATPFFVLPSTLAVSSALSILFLSGELLLNANRYSKEIPAKWLNFKTGVRYAFRAKPDETSQSATLRIVRNIALATAAGLATCLVAFAAHHFVITALAAKAAGTLRIWDLQNYLPSQTQLVVFLEYGALAFGHTCLAIKKISEGKKIEALFHLANAVLGIYFPSYYFIHATPASPMRLHHSFLGLLISLAPFKTLKIYGSITTLDSGLYHIFHDQGFWAYNARWNTWRFQNWDFQNLVIDHKALYPAVFTTTTVAEAASNGVFCE